MIGDGALTGGMAWEALNNIAAGRDRTWSSCVNDNGRSYAPTIGGMAERLAALRLQPGYERMLGPGKDTLPRTPVVGRPLYTALHAAKAAVKDWLIPQTLFADLGLKYLGPIDGHDVAAMESALRRARDFRGPVLVHCVTHKGAATRPRSTTTPSRCTPRRRSTPTPACRTAPAPRWTQVFAGRWWRSGTRARTSSRSPRRCSGRPGWCRSPTRSRTGASTSASPSSTR